MTFIYYNPNLRIAVKVEAETSLLANLEMETKYGIRAYKNWECLGTVETMVQVYNN